MRVHKENHDQFAEDYTFRNLDPIKHFVQSKKSHGKLILGDHDKTELIQLIDKCLDITVSFDFAQLSCLEVLDLVLSFFLNSSRDRAQILGTTSGSLRNMSVNLYNKLKANNRFHAMLIATRLGILKIS